jgi:hypothetical protein
MLQAIGQRLAAYLTEEGHAHGASPPTNQQLLKDALRPADVLLVEGTSRIGAAIKYLTQSTWSHAALFMGDVVDLPDGSRNAFTFIEADVAEGVRAVNVQKYEDYHCRICRPVGLSPDDAKKVLANAASRLGHKYDIRNILDLARYLMPMPPVPASWRRKMIAFGSGDPTQAICSTLIAQAFQSVRFPILPQTTTMRAAREDCPACMKEIMHIRHHSLFVPRDFDVSPYFEIVKPALSDNFDYRAISWDQE